MTVIPIEKQENEKFSERRAFPRIEASCPVLYRLGAAERWQVAKMEEYSAVGMRIACDENLPKGTFIAIQVKPGSVKTIPQLSLEGEVVHSDLNDEERFVVSVKILKVLRNP